MKRLFVSLLFLVNTAWAEAEVEPAALPEVPVNSKISHFKDYSTIAEIKPYLQIANFSFYVGAPDIHGKAYVPNFSTLAGLSAGWKAYGIATGISLPIPKEEIDRRGKSDQFNLIGSKYWRQSAVDLYFQRYRGFYAGNPANELNIDKPERFTQFPNAYSINYGVNYYYALNEDEYSFKSSFGFKEEQLQSGGSPLWHAFYNHLELSLGNTIIPGTQPDDIQIMPVLQDVALETLGVGYGYGYTWILGQYVATAQIVAAAGMQSASATANSDMLKSVYTVAYKGNLNLSLAYKMKDGAIGLRFLMDSLYSNVNDDQLYSTFMVGTLFFQFRI